MGVIFGLILIIMGAVYTISPETGWHISEGWKFRDAEPSDNALLWIRICGVVAIAAGFYFMFKG